MKQKAYAGNNLYSQSITPHGELFIVGSPHLTWEQFLPLLEEFCKQQGWEIEYGHVNDGSCAIFSQSYLLANQSEEISDN